MYEQFFEDPSNCKIWPDDFDKSTLPNDRWTPAEAAQILLNHIHNPHQALAHFVTEFPKSGYEPKDNTQIRNNVVDEKSPICNPYEVVPINSTLIDCDEQDGEASNSEDLNSHESTDSSESMWDEKDAEASNSEDLNSDESTDSSESLL